MTKSIDQVRTEGEWVDLLVKRAKRQKKQFAIYRVLGAKKVVILEKGGRINFFFRELENGIFEMNARYIKSGMKGIQAKPFQWSEGMKKSQLETRIKEMENQMQEQINSKEA